jgi:hypothetical protein
VRATVPSLTPPFRLQPVPCQPHGYIGSHESSLHSAASTASTQSNISGRSRTGQSPCRRRERTSYRLLRSGGLCLMPVFGPETSRGNCGSKSCGALFITILPRFLTAKRGDGYTQVNLRVARRDLLRPSLAVSLLNFILKFACRRSLRGDARLLPAVCLDRRWLRLIPWENAMRSSPLAQAHRLRACKPLFRLLRYLEQ